MKIPYYLKNDNGGYDEVLLTKDDILILLDKSRVEGDVLVLDEDNWEIVDE